MSFFKLLSLQKKASFRIGDDDYSIGGMPEFENGQIGLIQSVSETDGVNRVKMETDNGVIDLSFDVMGFSADEATKIWSGIRMPRSKTFGPIVLKEGGGGFKRVNGIRSDYRVLRMNTDLAVMTVEYIDGPLAGRRHVLNVDQEAEDMLLYTREEMRRQTGIGMEDISDGEKESWTMGFYARNAVFECAVREDDVEELKGIYTNLTGDDLEPFIKRKTRRGGLADESIEDTISPDGRKVWVRNMHRSRKTSGRISYAPPPDELKHLLVSRQGEMPPYEVGEGGLAWYEAGTQIHNISPKYFFNLLRIGFKMGSNHDVDRIREGVSNPEWFDKGYQQLGQEMGGETSEEIGENRVA